MLCGMWPLITPAPATSCLPTLIFIPATASRSLQNNGPKSNSPHAVPVVAMPNIVMSPSFENFFVASVAVLRIFLCIYPFSGTSSLTLMLHSCFLPSFAKAAPRTFPETSGSSLKRPAHVHAIKFTTIQVFFCHFSSSTAAAQTCTCLLLFTSFALYRPHYCAQRHQLPALYGSIRAVPCRIRVPLGALLYC